MGGIETAYLIGKRSATGDDNDPLPGSGGRERLPDGSECAGDVADRSADLDDSRCL
ncbi:MAG: hypothetical protein SGJ01_01340 [Gemmatimonadota bacterium]|nr:hypothetical protein [Gemmatimonadota bacterium]